MATKKYQVQILSTVLMSRAINADSLEDAVKIAEAMAERQDNGVRAKKDWDYEYSDTSKVTGVFQ